MPAIFSPDQIVSTLRARWTRVALVCLLVVGAVVAASLLLPPRYEATAALVVDMNGPDPVAPKDVFKPAGAVSTYTATQADILRSQEVALGAARLLGLHEQPEWRERWQRATGGEGSFEAWLAQELLRRLDVRPARDSNVLTLSYTSPDAAFSAEAANAFVRAYIDTTLQMRVAPAKDFNAFFAQRAEPLRAALDQARERLSAYEKKHGVAIGNEPDAESARLAQLTAQLVVLQDQAAGAANARRQAGASPADMREVRTDPEVGALTAEKIRQEGRLAELKTEFGEQHHAVIQARRGIADTQRRLDAAMRRAVQGFEAPLRVNQARVAETQAAVERQRAVVMRRKAQRDAAAALVRDVENAQKAYDAVLARASQTALESASTAQGNVSVLKAATPPLWSPVPLIANVTVAVLLGLLLGVASALFKERRDARLRTALDVTRRLQQTFLLALPDGKATRRGRPSGRSDETRARLVGAQPRLAGPR